MSYLIDVASVRKGHLVPYRGKMEFRNISDARAKVIYLLGMKKKTKNVMVSHTIYEGPGVAKRSIGMVFKNNGGWVWEDYDTNTLVPIYTNGKAKKIKL